MGNRGYVRFDGMLLYPESGRGTRHSIVERNERGAACEVGLASYEGTPVTLQSGARQQVRQVALHCIRVSTATCVGHLE